MPLDIVSEKAIGPLDREIAHALIKDIGQGDTVSLPRARLASLLQIASAQGRKAVDEGAKVTGRPKLRTGVQVAVFLILIGAGAAALADSYMAASQFSRYGTHLNPAMFGLGCALLAAAWLMYRKQIMAGTK